MADDLRAAAERVVAEALVQHDWNGSFSKHADHRYYYDCAICQGDVPAIAAVAVAALLDGVGEHG